LANERNSCSPGTTFRAEMGFSFRIANGVDRLEERGHEIQITALHRSRCRSSQKWENARL